MEKKKDRNNHFHHLDFLHLCLTETDKRNNVPRGDTGQRVPTFSYKTSKSCGSNGQHGDCT